MEAHIVKQPASTVIERAESLTTYLLGNRHTMSAESVCKNVARVWRDARREIRDGRLE